jgi:plastocyanin
VKGRAPARAILAALTLAGAAGGATALAVASAASAPVTVEIRIHHSHYEPAWVTVPAGRAVTFVIRNDDPIDHEWIVGDAALHERHRTGTEPYHATRPTEISVDALTTKRTTITFDAPATLQYICHLPGHEAYGMAGTVVVAP